jgi:uncharacterized OB-fold protein
VGRLRRRQRGHPGQGNVTAVPPATPVPPDGLNGEWYEYCRLGELRFQRCAGCGRWRHPPRFRCPQCGSEEWTWERSSGRGQVFSWTVTHQAPRPGWADAVPYAALVVELDEGVRVVAGLRELAPAELRLGQPVVVGFEALSDAFTIPVFRPTP